ncbi:hypothetical protein O181_057169 [Austropuccinia psidii MF-1]|uniref:Uncharacterized protein n=1 Tax=Austropuccinia psidii MF-1 TaxID=1389203 RepID=A0A9Q3E9X1_9BASI|nr:hypothetical protein [Austropuccinia psidii MF-1]
MEDSRTLTSSQRLASTFGTLIESPENEITSIPVSRHESFSTGNSGDVPVSVQELFYGGKESRGGTSANPLYRHNELSSSSEEVHGPRKDSRPSEGLETHVLQRRSPKEESMVEKPK